MAEQERRPQVGEWWYVSYKSIFSHSPPRVFKEKVKGVSGNVYVVIDCAWNLSVVSADQMLCKIPRPWWAFWR